MSFLKYVRILSPLSLKASLWVGLAFVCVSCAPVDTPASRNVSIPAPLTPSEKPDAINAGYEPVVYVPLGEDILVPETTYADELPEHEVGPFELRSETLAAALQLVLAEYEIPLAFETEEGLSRRITVSGLRGSLDEVVSAVCGLANLYCAYEDGLVVVREEETFIVALPPIGDEGIFDDIASGLQAITGADATVDNVTRTIIYTATHRTARRAERYFDRLRGSTALIIYEVYIWEVGLNNANTYGIDWDLFDNIGKFNMSFALDGSTSADITGQPVTLGLPTTGTAGATDVLEFLAEQGTVKTISQPQLTLLSGASASLRVAQTDNYIENLSRTVDEDGDETVSTTTSSVDSGFSLEIASSWDEGTVYGTISIELDELIEFEDFPAGAGDQLSLPRTSERDLETQVRVRPGDFILMAGLLSEQDNFSRSGPGINEPLFNSSRTTSTDNTELVILMRPRVVAYVPEKVQQQAAKSERREKRRLERVQNALDYGDPEEEVGRSFFGTLSPESLNPSLGGGL